MIATSEIKELGMQTTKMNNTAIKVSINIVGAGPAGSLAAWLLAQQGHQVQVFERSTYPIKGKICGEYLCPTGVNLIKSLKLGGLIGDYPKVLGMNIFDSLGLMVPTNFPGGQVGISLRRDQFDNDLIQKAMEAGVIFHFGHSVWQIHEEGNSIFLHTHTPEKQEKVFESELLIGADGRQSIVGTYINAKKKHHAGRVAIHGYLNTPIGALNHHGEMHLFNDGAYCGLNPVSNNLCNFSIVCEGKIVSSMKKSGISSVVKYYVDQSIRLKELFSGQINQGHFNIQGGITNPVGSLSNLKGNVVLIGDAAGFIDPLTGEGIYHALLTAKLYCEKLLISKSFQTCANHYHDKVDSIYAAKEKVNYLFQWLIKRPTFCHLISKFLNRRKVARDAFVGLIGNIYTPFQALKIIFMSSIKSEKGN
jgi:flavin-dependent dehydrogenase